MSCEGLNNVTKSGACTPGQINGLIFFKDKPADIDLTSATLRATWETLADVLPPDNLMYFKAFDSELTDNETVMEEGLGGEQLVVDEKFATDKFMIIADECALQGAYEQFKNGQIVYGFWTTLKHAIIGKYSDDKTKLSPIKFYITTTSTKATKDKTAKVVFNIQVKENYLGRQKAVGIDFDFDEIETVRTSYITSASGDSVAKTITFDMWYCGGVLNADAVLAGFTVLNSLGAPVVASGVTKVGNNYTLTGFASLPAGTYTVSYNPTVGSDYIWLPSSSVTVV